VVARAEKILILDRGNVELAFPKKWAVKLEPGGHMSLTDPSDSAKLEVSYLPFAIPKGVGPTLSELLREVLERMPDGEMPEIVSLDRGDLWLAWADRPHECDDTERGERRNAHTRTLIASNGRFYVIVTFAYWHDDLAWAVPAWERMIATLHLGDGTQLRSAFEHWSMKKRGRAT
jgi:hypothetical protein